MDGYAKQSRHFDDDSYYKAGNYNGSALVVHLQRRPLCQVKRPQVLHRKIPWVISGKGSPSPIFGLLQPIRYSKCPAVSGPHWEHPFVRPLGRCGYRDRSGSSLVDTRVSAHSRTRELALDMTRFVQGSISGLQAESYQLETLFADCRTCHISRRVLLFSRSANVARALCVSMCRINGLANVGAGLNSPESLLQDSVGTSGKGNPRPIFGLPQSI